MIHAHFHTIIRVDPSLLSMSPVPELETSDGRIDMAIELLNNVYVIEFKCSSDNKDKSHEALDQI
ncbi:MAG: PD-(D/E)XK nuclease domain-containing protein [Bacteroidales bacterium]|nr:PD-(D/E)XK nuclease domain-containing protein [Bacteroidales bacterium]